MNIDGRSIGADQPPYLICEIGANHGGDLDLALRTMDAAKAAGADCVKFQCYEADTITLNCDRPEFVIADGPWKGQRLYDLYRRAQTPFAWFPRIAEHAKKLGITWFASVFDKSSVDLMERLEAPAIKIASFELVDAPLIRYAARLGKPMILSTGMASDKEIRSALHATHGADGAALLHCVSGYPVPAGEANLRRMAWLRGPLWARQAFGVAAETGLSDHTTGIEIPVAATVLGAAIVEKHFTLSSTTPDATFSLEPKEFAAMAAAVRNAWAACQPSPAPSQDMHRPLRRSVFAVADIAAGSPFTETNIRSIRPGHGLPPSRLPDLIGRTCPRDIARGEPIGEWALAKS
jgi:N-acetylneuraminate synthase